MQGRDLLPICESRNQDLALVDGKGVVHSNPDYALVDKLKYTALGQCILASFLPISCVTFGGIT